MFITSIICIIALVGFDQWTKWWTIAHLKHQNDIIVLDGIFKLTYVENRGAAFGMLQNQIAIFALFTIITMLVMIMIYYILPRQKLYIPLRVTMVLLFSGALGNFIDRIRDGFVVDMFHFHWFEFPVFNVADILVVIACFSLIYLVLFHYNEDDLDIKKWLRDRHE
ncbi:signal peptidase II [Petrocella sp. FN5]|uniref:signal peptidase II n=1 Tax=Petrocella sp. FN5 TaxID=3032002 RepID=UPI0023DAD177|nr:signal peptidase II [Petrocella sp. FN5]MDF1616309.1 signal peptidase II [Petrocella sp. FN5]